MEIKIPSHVYELLSVLKAAGFEGYIVGGCVRDNILGKTPMDYDICTDATPQEIKHTFKCFNTIDTGIEHGTITVMVKDCPFEITTYRMDGKYSDNRRPDKVCFVSNLAEDLKRRDFTINAMAYNPISGLVDNHGGILDLKNGVVRTVGNPDTRFKEDALRIMRALRFASVYNFSIDDDTKLAIHNLKELLNNVSIERLNTEFTKLLVGENAVNILLEYSDVVEVLIPEISSAIGFLQNNLYHKYNVYEHSVRALGYAPKNIILRLTMLLHDIGKPACHERDIDGTDHFYGHEKPSSLIATDILKRFRYDNHTINAVTELVKIHGVLFTPTKKTVKRWLNRLGEEQFERFIIVKNSDIMAQSGQDLDKRIAINNEILNLARQIIEENQCYSLKDLEINGNDIISIGVPKGKEVGNILSALLELVIDEELPNKKANLLAKAKHIYFNN